MINMQNKIDEIVAGIKKIYGERPGVIGVSGGVDSALSLTLLTRALGTVRVTPMCCRIKIKTWQTPRQSWNLMD